MKQINGLVKVKILSAPGLLELQDAVNDYLESIGGFRIIDVKYIIFDTQDSLYPVEYSAMVIYQEIKFLHEDKDYEIQS